MTDFRAEILTIGNELLRGSTLNTNAQFLGRELTQLGFHVTAQWACRDNRQEICEVLAAVLDRTDLVVITGGLGPTPDDLTRDAVSDFFHSPLVFSKEQFQHVRAWYRFRGKPMPAIVRREALFPAVAEPLINPYGIALGFLIRRNRKMIVVLPGVPEELEKMYCQKVRRILLRHFPGLRPKPPLIIKAVGISEPGIMRRLGRSFFNLPAEFGVYPAAGETSIVVRTNNTSLQNRLRQIAKKRLGEFIYGWQDDSLPDVIGRLLRKKGYTLAIAESCTGGLLSHLVTQAAGASRYFRGAVTAYHNDIKIGFAGVQPATLIQYGAVSKETASELSRNIRNRMHASYGIGVTGIAGPGGGSTAKPVGTVFISIAGPRTVRTWRETFRGDRGQIQLRSAAKALEYLWRTIR
jgi:nicotinamide-nucleotide amidase